MYNLFVLILIAAVSAAAGFFLRKKIAGQQLESAESLAEKVIKEAHERAEVLKQKGNLEVKDLLFKKQQSLEKEIDTRRADFVHQERRLQKKEETLDRRFSQLDTKEQNLASQRAAYQRKERLCDESLENQKALLEQVAQMTVSEAKKELRKKIESEAYRESAAKLRMIEQETKEKAHKQSCRIIATAIGRLASDQVSEGTVSTVKLPDNDMKGRIIGREGRNIRALEKATGIDLIVDDTPGAVTLSGFDAVRREVARISLERLMQDGRIHPGRIEEIVGKVRKEIDVHIRETGEQAALEVNVHSLHPEIIKLIGRLKYRTSYSQNILEHSKEVAFLAGIMAAELGLNVKLAKRGGFLHDIGKAIDHTVEGSHDTLGAEIAKRYKESAQVVNAIHAHHELIEPTSFESVLVGAADALSAARPGVRRESLGAYVKRMDELEDIANSFSGVNRTFAIQAGRELRVMVDQGKISDNEASDLARNIAHRIEDELKYPGLIKVIVIRESRAVEYAH